MAFYDDGGVEFAQKQFSDVRARKEKEAKKQDKFSRNLMVLDGLLGLGDNILNKKADKLQNEGVLARSHYLSSLDNSNAFNKEQNQYVQDGLTTQDILYNETKDKLTNYTQEKFGEGYDISQFMDGINNIATDYSKDADNLEKYQAVIDAHSKIPTMSPAEFIAYSRDQTQPVRTVGEFLGNKVKKVFQSHDEETLSEEDRIGKERTLNGILGENFAGVKKAIEQFSEAGNPINELTDFINKNPDLIAFKNATTEIKPVTIIRNGKTTVTNYIVSSAQSSDGRIIELSPPIATTESTKDGGLPVYSPAALQLGSARINEWAKNASANDAEFKDDFKYMQKNFPTLLTESVLSIQDNLINNYGMSKNKALGIATRYAVGQDSSEIDINPSLFDIDMASGLIDTDKILNYVESIKLVKGDVFVPNELKVMRDRLVNTIANSNVDDNTKREDIEAIYEIMDGEGIVRPNEFNKIAIDNSNLKPEDKTIAEKVNEVPIIGPLNEFLFDDSYDAIDATIFLGGYGALRMVLKKSIKPLVGKVAIKVGGKILSSPKMAAFIKKAAKFANPKLNPAGRELFIKNMNPLQRAAFRSMNAKGNIDTAAFMARVAKLPGIKIVESGMLPGVQSTFGKYAYGALGAYIAYSATQTENIDLNEDED